MLILCHNLSKATQLGRTDPESESGPSDFKAPPSLTPHPASPMGFISNNKHVPALLCPVSGHLKPRVPHHLPFPFRAVPTADQEEAVEKQPGLWQLPAWT